MIKKVRLLPTEEAGINDMITSMTNQIVTMKHLKSHGVAIPTHNAFTVGTATLKITYVHDFKGIKSYIQSQYCTITIGDEALDMDIEHFLVEFVATLSSRTSKYKRILEATEYLKNNMIISPNYNHVITGDLNTIIASLMV